MALSTGAQERLKDTLGDANASTDLQAAILGRVAIQANTKTRLDIAMGSNGLSSQAYGNEVSNAVVSGANLSYEARRRILIMMGDPSFGNELINAIQSSPQSSPTVL